MAEITIARLIHVSDLHLYVDGSGRARPEKDAVAIVRAARAVMTHAAGSAAADLAHGLEHHSTEALDALEASLLDLAANRTGLPADVPLIVVETGDVEAYGGFETDAGWSFAGFDHVRRLAKVVARHGVEWISLFGNHDLWPGTLPLLRPLDTGAVARALRNVPEFTAPLPDLRVLSAPKGFVELYRLITPVSDAIPNTLSHGFVEPDPQLGHGTYPASGRMDPLLEIATLATSAAARAAPTVRVLLTHHPFHPVASAGGIGAWLKEGPVLNAAESVSRLQATGQRFHLMLSGHRHRLDPPRKVTIDQTGPRQPPFEEGTVQLCAASATQDPPGWDPEAPRPAFSVLDVIVDEQAGSWSVERTVHAFRASTDTLFKASKPRRCVRDMRL